MTKKKLIIGISGASGALYAKLLLQKLETLKEQIDSCIVIHSENALLIWKDELGEDFSLPSGFRQYDNNDFNAPCASGSTLYDTMIVCPCSMGFIGRLAAGVSNDLMSRAADVMLKERRRLILVPRETPLNLIHLNNMTLLTQAGAIICPAAPSFYSHPQSIQELCNTVVDRIIDLAGFSHNSFRWNDR